MLNYGTFYVEHDITQSSLDHPHDFTQLTSTSWQCYRHVIGSNIALYRNIKRVDTALYSTVRINKMQICVRHTANNTVPIQIHCLLKAEPAGK